MASLVCGPRAESKLDARKGSVQRKSKERAPVSLVICEPFDCTDLSLGSGELIADFVGRDVGL
jgi:hypothetical protein